MKKAGSIGVIAFLIIVTSVAFIFVLLSPDLVVDATEKQLREYATTTWQSIDAMYPPENVLPADHLFEDGTLATYTSPTNIASFLWSTLAARDLDLITDDEAYEHLVRTLDSVQLLSGHEESGLFYNWYETGSGEMMTIWVDGSTVCPFLSTVDNGWLAASFLMVAEAEPRLADSANALVNAMDFAFLYDENAGLLYGGYTPAGVQPDGSCEDGYTDFHFGTLNTEARIASYVAIAMGQIPPSHYFRMWRTLPSSCDWGWHEMMPGGEAVDYIISDSLPGELERRMTVTVFEGHYFYHDMRIVPSWGGSMFEALMPNLLVPEADWGVNSWGINHPLYVEAQIEHGLEEAEYGYWGFSPSSQPPDGYREYGVDALGMLADGYASDADNTFVDYGFGDCPDRNPESNPDASAYISGVITPHAVFLALEFAPEEALQNLDNLRENFPVYHETYGFFDAVQVDSSVIAQRFLALDQGMIMLAIGNELSDDNLRRYFADRVANQIQPLLELERFSAGRN